MSQDTTEVTHSSSLIASARYNRKQLVLVVTLRTGEVYEFQGVPLDVYNSFVTSQSLGRAFNTNIKNKFPGKRLA